MRNSTISNTHQCAVPGVLALAQWLQLAQPGTILLPLVRRRLRLVGMGPKHNRMACPKQTGLSL